MGTRLKTFRRATLDGMLAASLGERAGRRESVGTKLTGNSPLKKSRRFLRRHREQLQATKHPATHDANAASGSPRRGCAAPHRQARVRLLQDQDSPREDGPAQPIGRTRNFLPLIFPSRSRFPPRSYRFLSHANKFPVSKLVNFPTASFYT